MERIPFGLTAGLAELELFNDLESLESIADERVAGLSFELSEHHGVLEIVVRVGLAEQRELVGLVDFVL